MHTTSWHTGIGAFHRPEGRHLISDAPIKLLPLSQENVTTALSPVDESSEIVNPTVRTIRGHCTCEQKLRMIATDKYYIETIVFFETVAIKVKTIH